jgi:hypothetical protein
MIYEWQKSTVHNKRGRKVDLTFEEQLLAQLVYNTIE